MYPKDKCYFCNNILNNYGECFYVECKIQHKYYVNLKDQDLNFSFIFKINNYAFEFFKDQTMCLIELDRFDSIINKIHIHKWLLINKNNITQIVDKIKKLEILK